MLLYESYVIYTYVIPFNPILEQGASTVSPTSVLFHVILNPIYFTVTIWQYSSKRVFNVIRFILNIINVLWLPKINLATPDRPIPPYEFLTEQVYSPVLYSDTSSMTRIDVFCPATRFLFKNHWYLKSSAPTPVAKQLNSAYPSFFVSICAGTIITEGGRTI